MVLTALMGSGETDPLRVGKIQANLVLGPKAPAIRSEVIEESLRRLTQAGKVRRTELKSRHAYYLSQAASEEITRLVDSGETLFQPVLRKLLENTSHLVGPEVGSAVCQSFISECFARLGGEIARLVAGHLRPDDLVHYADVRASFQAATDGRNLSAEAMESLEARCFEFLTSAAPDAARLKFYLAQGHFFAQLVGLEPQGFNLIAEEAFRGSVFYLDTNVILAGVLTSDGTADLFAEMVRVAKRIGVELKVTRATLDEARYALADRRKALDKVQSLPEEIVRATRDQFAIAFLEARAVNPDLSPEEFLSPLEHIGDVILPEWGVELVEQTADEIIGGEDLTQAEQIIQEETLNTRGWPKGEAVLRHDVCHYSLVSKERTHNPRTWFLTRDRALAQAALRLTPSGGRPFCFSLLGFLQSLSPFLTTDLEEHRMADFFSAVLEERIFPHPPLFDVGELALLAEMHQDVLSTPKERLIPAPDYIKHTVLRGNPYSVADCPKVALGLRTFLATSGEERRRELAAQAVTSRTEAEQERAAAGVERRARLEAQETIQAQVAEILDLNERNRALSQELRRVRLYRMLGGFVVALVWWHSSDPVRKVLSGWGLGSPAWDNAVRYLLGLFGIILFCVPAFDFLRRERWAGRVKSGIFAFVLGSALVSSRLLDKATWSASWPRVLDLVTFVAGFLFAVFGSKTFAARNRGPGSA
jgi:hypothetical protein